MTSLGAASIELSLDRSRFDRDLAQLSQENAPSLTPRLKLDVKDFNNQIAGLQGFIPTLSVPVSLDTSSIRSADIRRQFSDIGRNAALGFADGFAGADKGIESTIDSLVKNAKSQLEIQSPSRVFREIGKYAADGLVQGLSDIDESKLKSTVDKLEDYFKKSKVNVDLDLKANLTTQKVKVQGSLFLEDGQNSDFTKKITASIELGFKKAQVKTNLFSSIFDGIGSIIARPFQSVLTGIFEGVGTPLGTELGTGVAKALQSRLGQSIGSLELVSQKAIEKSLDAIPKATEAIVETVKSNPIGNVVAKQLELLQRTLEQYNINLSPKAAVKSLASDEERAIASSSATFTTQQSDFKSLKKARAAASNEFVSIVDNKKNLDKISELIKEKETDVKKNLEKLKSFQDAIANLEKLIQLPTTTPEDGGKIRSRIKELSEAIAGGSEKIQEDTQSIAALNQSKQEYVERLFSQIKILAGLGVEKQLTSELNVLLEGTSAYQSQLSVQQSIQKQREGIKTNAKTPDSIKDKKLEKLQSLAESSKKAVENIDADTTPEQFTRLKAREQSASKALDLYKLELADPGKAIAELNQKLEKGSLALNKRIQQLRDRLSNSLPSLIQDASQETVKVGNFPKISKPTISTDYRNQPEIYRQIFKQVVATSGSNAQIDKLPNLAVADDFRSSVDARYNPKTNRVEVPQQTFDSIQSGKFDPKLTEVLVHELRHALQFGFGSSDLAKGGESSGSPLLTPTDAEVKKFGRKIEQSVEAQPKNLQPITRQLESDAYTFADRHATKIHQDATQAASISQFEQTFGIGNSKLDLKISKAQAIASKEILKISESLKEFGLDISVEVDAASTKLGEIHSNIKNALAQASSKLDIKLLSPQELEQLQIIFESYLSKAVSSFKDQVHLVEEVATSKKAVLGETASVAVEPVKEEAITNPKTSNPASTDEQKFNEAFKALQLDKLVMPREDLQKLSQSYGLSKSESEALQSYVNGPYNFINNYLREGKQGLIKILDQLKQQATDYEIPLADIHSAYGGNFDIGIDDLEKYVADISRFIANTLEKIPNFKGVVFRGEGMAEDIESVQARIEKIKSEGTTEASAFTSSGIDAPFKGKVQYVTKSRKGKIIQSTDVDDGGAAGETLHNQGTKFKVLGTQNADQPLQIPDIFDKEEVKKIQSVLSPQNLKNVGAQVVVYLEEIDEAIHAKAKEIEKLPKVELPQQSPQQPIKPTYNPTFAKATEIDKLSYSYVRGKKLAPDLSKKYGLNADEQAALAAYTATGLFDSINSYLRGGVEELQKSVARAKERIKEKRQSGLSSEEIQKRLLPDFSVQEGLEERIQVYAKTLSSALAKIPASTNHDLLFRGAGPVSPFTDYQPGTEHTFPAFTSVAEKNPFSTPTQFAILPKSAKDITPFAPLANLGEKAGGAAFGSELLFDKDTTTRVLARKELSEAERTGKTQLDLSGIQGVSPEHIEKIKSQYTPEFIKKSGTEVIVILEEIAKEVASALSETHQAIASVQKDILPIIQQIQSLPKIELPENPLSSSLEFKSSQDVRDFTSSNLNSKGVKDLARKLSIDTKNANKEHLLDEISSLAGTAENRERIAQLVQNTSPDKFLTSSALNRNEAQSNNASEIIDKLKSARKTLADALKSSLELSNEDQKTALAQIIESAREQEAIAHQLSSEYQLTPTQGKQLGGVRSQLRNVSDQSKQSLAGIESTEQPKQIGQELGENLVSAIGTGINAEKSQPINEIVGVMESVEIAAKNQAEIRSPSRVFQRIGKFISEGLALGIESGQELVENAIALLINTYKKELSPETISEVLKGTVAGIDSKLEKFEVKAKIVEDIQDDDAKSIESKRRSTNPDNRDKERSDIQARARLSSNLERRYGLEGLAPEILPDRIKESGETIKGDTSIFQAVKDVFKSFDKDIASKLKKRASQLALEVESAIAPSLETTAIAERQGGQEAKAKQYEDLAHVARTATKGVGKILESGEDLTPKQVAQLEKLTAQLESVYDTIGRPLPSQGFVESFSLGIKGAVGNLGSLVKGILAFQGLMTLQNFLSTAGQDAFKAYVEFDKLKTALNFASGGSGAGANNLAFVKKQVEDLAIPLEASVKGFTQLAGAARGTAIEGQQTKELFLGISQASTVLSLSSEDTEGAIGALEKILSEGKVSSEALREELGTRIPGAFAIAARATGVTEEEFTRLLETGQVLSQDFLPKFGKQLQSEFGEASKTASDNAQSAIFKLQNAWLSLQQSVGEGVAPVAIPGLKLLSGTLSIVADHVKDLMAIAASAALVMSFNLASALKTVIANLVETKLATGTLGGGLQSLAQAANNSLSLKIGAAIFGVIEIVKLLNDQVNTDLVKSFDDAADAAIRAADASEKAFGIKKEKTESDLGAITDNVLINPINSVLQKIPGLPKIKTREDAEKEDKTEHPRASSDTGKFFDDFLINPLNFVVQHTFTDIPKFATTGESEKTRALDRDKQQDQATQLLLSGAKLQENEIKTQTGDIGQLPALDKTLRDRSLQQQILQAQAKRDYTDKGLAIPANIQTRIAQGSDQINQLNNKRVEIGKPYDDKITALNQGIVRYKSLLEQLKDPKYIANLGDEDIDKLSQKYKKNIELLTQQKNSLEASSAAYNINPILKFNDAYRKLNLTLNETTEANQIATTKREISSAQARLQGFSTNRLAGRQSALKDAMDANESASIEFQNQQKILDARNAEVRSPALQPQLQRLGVTPDSSVSKIQDVLDNTKEESDKALLEKIKVIREQEVKTVGAKKTSVEASEKVKQVTQDNTLSEIQFGAGRATAAIQKRENLNIAKVRKAQEDRTITETEAAEKIARIQLRSTNDQQKSTDIQLRLLREGYKQGIIGAEQFTDRQKELTTEQTNLQKQSAEQQLAVFEAVNRRKIELIELANKKAEAAIALSQTLATTGVKQGVLGGRIDIQEAPRQQNLIDQTYSRQQIKQIKTELAQNATKRAKKIISPELADEKRLELNQRLAVANQGLIDQQLQAQEQLRARVEKGFQRRKDQSELQISQANTSVQQGYLEQFKAPEIDEKGLDLARTGVTLNNSSVLASKNIGTLQEELAGVDKLGYAKKDADDKKRALKSEIEKLRQQQIQIEIDLIKNKEEIEINAIERVQKAEENRFKLATSNIEQQKSALELYTASLDRTAKLEESRNNLQKAVSDVGLSGLDIRKESANRALELSRRVKNDANLDPKVASEINRQLNQAGFGTNELDILKKRQQIEDEIAGKKLAALQIEQEFQRKSLVLDLKRQQIAAQTAVYDAESAQIAASKSKLEADNALRIAQIKRDPVEIQIAKVGVELADRDIDLSDRKLQNAKDNLGIQDELARNSVLTQEATQRSAIDQQLAADSARKQAGALERVEASVSKMNAESKADSKADEAAADIFKQKPGEGLFDYNLRINKAKTFGQILETRNSTNIAGDGFNLNPATATVANGNYGGLDRITPLSTPTAIAPATKDTVAQALADSKIKVAPSSPGYDQFADALKAANKGIESRLDKLLDSFTATINAPKSLTVMSPNPVDDAAKIYNDMSKDMVRSSGL